MFRSVFAAGSSSFKEIEVGLNNKTCITTGLNVTDVVDILDRGHRIVDWMTDRKNKNQMQCVIRAYFTRCYCDTKASSCNDYNEVTNTVYMVARDKPNATVPLRISGNNIYALANLNCTLTALHNSMSASHLMYNKMASGGQLSTGEVISQEICHTKGTVYYLSLLEKRQFFPKNVNRTYGRNEMQMEIGHDETGLKTCAFFYCQRAICPGTAEMRYLAMKEKFIEQYTSDKKLYECSLPPSECGLSTVKKTIPDYLFVLLSQANAKFPTLHERPVNLSTLTTRLKWIPSASERHERVGGSIISWILSMLFLIFILLTARSVSLYEFPEERKELNPAYFRLRDVEKELTKLLRKRSKEQTTLSLQGVIQWEAAKKAERKRRKAQKGRIFRSMALASANEASDIESVKKKTARAGTLQQTQNETNPKAAAMSDPLKSVIPRDPQPLPPGQRSLQVTQNEVTPILGGQISQMPVLLGPRARTPLGRAQTPSHNSAEESRVYPTRTPSPASKNKTMGSLEKLEEIKAKRKYSREQQKRRKKAVRKTSSQASSQASAQKIDTPSQPANGQNIRK